MCPVHKAEDLVLPPDVERVLALGPKFAVEPSPTAPKLLALVRQASRQAPEEEQERFVSEGVDVLVHHRQGNSRIPLKSVEAYLEAKSLTVLPADKEGGCAVQSFPPQVPLQKQTGVSVAIAESAIDSDVAGVTVKIQAGVSNDSLFFKSMIPTWDTTGDDGVGCPMEIRSETLWIRKTLGLRVIT
ncbi:hypothetical protein HPB52_021481 [Rhipicephalus sanguineus]|uniref:Uncharacterized protein n=1 Tax=Rhipicephalus sanguineus TaxID=34632 RepID=A0A9D4QFM2_RHISA|nr:hypothetical protein HPB52_021481 [Rhipicephalus sanguineus]